MASPTSPRTTGERNRALDGLRGFAALGVFSSHLVTHLGLLPFVPLGVTGVVVFFVLSGYLIAGISWRMAPGPRAYGRFLRRRVERLAPVLLAVVLVGTPVVALTSGASPQQLTTDAVAVLGQVTAFVMASGGTVSEIFQPTWSLTVEWCFYLLAPLVIVGVRTSRWREQVVATTAVLAAVLYVSGLAVTPLSFYLLPIANLGAMFAGAALALRHQRRATPTVPIDPARSWMAVALLSVFVVLPGTAIGYGWMLAVFPATVVAALVVVHGCWTGGPTARTLAARPLHWVGRRAYSLYLWHVPVMWVAWVVVPGPAWVQAAVAVAATGVVVWGSFEALERPVLSRSRTSGAPTPPAPVPGRAGGVA